MSLPSPLRYSPASLWEAIRGYQVQVKELFGGNASVRESFAFAASDGLCCSTKLRPIASNSPARKSPNAPLRSSASAVISSWEGVMPFTGA